MIPKTSHHSIQFQIPKFEDARLQEYRSLWDAWWADPNLTNSQALLSFMKNFQQDFQDRAAHLPCPFSPPMSQSFDHYYNAVLKQLERFIVLECPEGAVTGMSQFIAYIWAWISPNS